MSNQEHKKETSKSTLSQTESDKNETAVGNSENFDVIKEKIKAKPLNKKKLLRKTVITAVMALIFGLIACVTFLILEPVISNLLYPEEEQQSEPITFPEDEEDVLPEDLLQTEEEDTDALEGITALTDEQLQAIVASMQLDINDYRLLYTKLYDIVRTAQQSMVNVTGVSYDVDWFDNTYESTDQASGVIVKNTGDDYLVLAYYETIKNADEFQVTFHDGTTADATLLQYDKNTGFAVFNVPLSGVDESSLATITVATLGSSSSSNILGSVVIALGSPMGYSNSLAYGVITSTGKTVEMIDKNYKLITTDIYGSTTATGIVVNLNGQVIGLIDNGMNNSDMVNLLSFIGISEMKKTIETMSNNIDASYIGIYGTDVTSAAMAEYGVPRGAYIKEIVMDSPAMVSGIQNGDIIIKLNSIVVSSFTDYSNYLSGYKADTTLEITVMRLNQNAYQEITFEVTTEKQ